MAFVGIVGAVIAAGAIAFAVLSATASGAAEVFRAGCAPQAGSLACHQFLGGEADVPVKLMVKNNGDPTDPAFEQISVVLGRGLMPVEANAVRADASSPEWGADVRDNLVTFSKGRLPGGTQQEFRITVDASRFTTDVTGTWSVLAFYRDAPAGSLNRSTTLAQMGTGLGTKVRALEISSLAPTAPQGATDRTVTQGQQNVAITAAIRNRGSAAIGVTATLSCPSNATVEAPASVTKTIPAGGGGVFPTETFGFVVDFADAGTTGQCRLEATAAGNTVAVKAGVEPFDPQPVVGFTLQPKAGIACQRLARNPNEAEVFTAPPMPLGLKPGAAPEWTLRVDKTGGQSLVLDGKETAAPTKLVIDLKKGGTDLLYEAPLLSSISLPGVQGGGTLTDAARLQFQPIAIDPLTDEDEYSIDLVVNGADGNGAALSTTLSSLTCVQPSNNPAVIRVDGTPPLVSDLTLSLPVSNSWKTAVKNSDAIQISGTVSRDSATDACPSIRVTPAQPGAPQQTRSLVRELDASGNVIAQSTPVTLSIQPVVGDASCTVASLPLSPPQPSYNPDTRSAEVYVEFEDSAGNIRMATSTVPPAPASGTDMFPCRPRICVDNIAPSIQVGRTGRHTDGTPNRLFVTFSEPMCAPEGVVMPPGTVCGVTGVDWQVVGHVQGAGGNFSRQQQRLELVMTNEFGTNERPLFAHTAATRTASPTMPFLFDRAGNALPRSSSAVQALDGIAPAHPRLLTVDGQGEQQETTSGGGSVSVFFTKERRPIFEFDGLDVDDIAEVFQDVNADGVINPDTDTRLAHCRAAPTDVVPEDATLECQSSRTLRNESTVDAPTRILIRSVDDGGNSSISAAQVARLLVIDQTPPRIATAIGCVGGASSDDDKIVITFTDKVAGGVDFGPNFVITSPTRTYLIAEAGEPNDEVLARLHRILAQISPDWHSDGPLTLHYELAPELAGAGRYQDRAGNEMPDHSISLTINDAAPECGIA